LGGGEGNRETRERTGRKDRERSKKRRKNYGPGRSVRKFFYEEGECSLGLSDCWGGEKRCGGVGWACKSFWAIKGAIGADISHRKRILGRRSSNLGLGPLQRARQEAEKEGQNAQSRDRNLHTNETRNGSSPGDHLRYQGRRPGA